MDLTFNRLLARSNAQEQSKIGDPWEVIPIKNRKQARDTEEIHLGQRGLETIKNFEDFPNLEVLYLNDNKMERLEGLDSNFRIKHLYLFNNKLKTLDGSLQFLNHLETLVLYKNELRDLDLNLSKMQHLTSLKQLDLFDNPLADEPHYRLRVIYAMPSVKVFDRHVVTQEERNKAKKFMETDYNQIRSKKDEKKVIKIPPSAMFSQNEKDLYKEATFIKKKRFEETQRLEEQTILMRTAQNIVFDTTKVPISKEKQEMERRKQEEPLSIITEWDKSRLKSLFKQFDKDKKAQIPLDKLGELYELIMADKGFVGKVPDCSVEEFIQKIQPERDTILQPGDKDYKEPPNYLTWDDFRFNLNKFYWVKPESDQANKRIKDLYYQANKKIYSGDLPNAKELLFKAIKIESQLGATETNKVLLKKTERIEQKNPRYDSFDFAKFTFKKDFSNTSKFVY
ncbi:hypothetical protein TTHERM_00157880 (macronuclear) [Tetrahymena thermophila SB210]|uniref:EF-hand domain-containing protein n=1 Tax=Tetrahymena thermophila (strain SB210) TaxID=312017 RepID=Q22WE6_TETTS|nr:hypothetical protein TTHERM_00157880 [Tetrahymena thermophila SB210]EAR89471.2 hypothetical protein TTHERM_00157880 [Tetrahymena thermophila SB210]|eukprot:XP_001009716.2 hypothetical protein TTHERM_00157880 [Tetrahymena thermophila SB210]